MKINVKIKPNKTDIFLKCLHDSILRKTNKIETHSGLSNGFTIHEFQVELPIDSKKICLNGKLKGLKKALLTQLKSQQLMGKLSMNGYV